MWVRPHISPAAVETARKEDGKDMKPKSVVLTLILILVFGGLIYSQWGEKAMPGTTASCGITLKVVGGQFSPAVCRFEIISGGAECKSNAGCPPDYALSMKDKAGSHIQEVVLFNFRSFAKQTYRFDPALNLKDFNGQLLDERAVARNLLKGDVSLEPVAAREASGDQRVRVSFDVSFANGIQLQGSGEVPVVRVSAP
jgi:hypothetical protein